MNYLIQNDKLKVEVLSKGAQLTSIQTIDGTEYLWQGDPAYWKGQAPNLFPYIGRMPEQKYSYLGQEYFMDKHGFARDQEFVCQQIREDYLMCYLEDSSKTRASYPFAFRFEIHYELDGSRLKVYFMIKNREGKEMYFGVGGHPGFRVPLYEQEQFEEYYLLFPEHAVPEKVGINSAGYLAGEAVKYKLEDGNRISLQHNLFDDDAIVLQNMGTEVVLCSAKGPVLAVRYPRMDYLGLWHMPKTESPYLCIEPWSSLPSRENTTEAFEEKPDLVCLEAYGNYCNMWEIEIL